MAASISFFSPDGVQIVDLTGSGIGYYGDSGFGSSITVGSYNGRTYITNSAGTAQGAEINNVKYVNSASGILGQSGSGIALTAIPNRQATLQARFSYDSAVKVQNAEFRAYNRSDISVGPSGIIVKAAEIIHPTIAQDNNGSGDTSWSTISGSGVVLSLANSPGPSGLYAGNGSSSLYQNKVHDWYIALSVSPSVIGSNLFAGYVSVEYL